MPRRRRLLLLTTNPNKVVEMERSLSKYDIEIEAVSPSEISSEDDIRKLLLTSGDSWYINGVMREQMNLYPANDNLQNFDACYKTEYGGGIPRKHARQAA